MKTSSLDHPLSIRSIKAMKVLVRTANISDLRKNLRLMTSALVFGEERELVDDHLALMLDMRSLLDLLEVLEGENR